MELLLLHTRDRARKVPLTPEQREAVRAVARGGGDETAASLARAVIALARRDGLWLGCDCREENGVPPVVTPCRNRHGTEYWHVLGYLQVVHSPGCMFHRAMARRRAETPWNRPARKAPEGYFAVLRNVSDDLDPSAPNERGEPWPSAAGQFCLSGSSQQQEPDDVGLPLFARPRSTVQRSMGPVDLIPGKEAEELPPVAVEPVCRPAGGLPGAPGKPTCCFGPARTGLSGPVPTTRRY